MIGANFVLKPLFVVPFSLKVKLTTLIEAFVLRKVCESQGRCINLKKLLSLYKLGFQVWELAASGMILYAIGLCRGAAKLTQVAAQDKLLSLE